VSQSHANCVENFPLFAAVVLTNKLVDGPDLTLYAGLSFTARCCQVMFHAKGVSDNEIVLRFYAFFPQLVILAIMAAKTATAI